MVILRHRHEFLACAKGRRFTTAAFVLQRYPRGDEGGPRFGFTVTKKTGGSPERNRIRRRLREAVRLSGVARAETGCDYVLIGRSEALSLPFTALQDDLSRALTRLAPRPGAELSRAEPGPNASSTA